ncbi:hypothetical protein GC098_18825 [Paenibacillus sp. LMG 31458]|uniref:YolD-like family protein n=1 Tax=Paenibacillus phytorum TaxID=2654977 RepID=A0ABX1XYX9_9BACL|nr:YolD-like family protein [Paenibacillus phytorum]NOU73449.1 hypothetical protein [Paenibacillus phytorum]
MLSQIEQSKLDRPLLEEVKYEEIIRTMGVAIFNDLLVEVSIWSDYGLQKIIGKIPKVSPVTKQIQVENDEEYAWIGIEDIMDIILL